MTMRMGEEYRRQKTEDRIQKTEDRRQKTEDKHTGQKPEARRHDGRQNAAGG
jgi:hypothetical protein